MRPNDADGMTNSVEPDQTAPLGAVRSGSAQFAFSTQYTDFYHRLENNF